MATPISNEQDINIVVLDDEGDQQAASDEVLDYDEGDEVEKEQIVQKGDRKEKLGDRMAFNGGKSIDDFQEKTEKTIQQDRKGGRGGRTITLARIPSGEKREDLFEGGEVTQCVSIAVGNSSVVKTNLSLKSRGKDMGIQADVEGDGNVGSDATKSNVVDSVKGSGCLAGLNRSGSSVLDSGAFLLPLG
ncbi:hypothetical protein NDU88_000635 [Pleurodeles waltl]|uniref:Uncharacterized protein n=1 Tax=Pleurodeles waltl TaxID=8319 RepID=A0AAV7VYS4_PLEWA|nr:hypothetical protein NDU88_000635 [Pleurodeles waltl]